MDLINVLPFIDFANQVAIKHNSKPKLCSLLDILA